VDPIVGNVHQQYGSCKPSNPDKERSGLIRFTTAFDKLLQGRKTVIIVHSRIRPQACLDNFVVIVFQRRSQKDVQKTEENAGTKGKYGRVP
jgi:hypothetical protein